MLAVIQSPGSARDLFQRSKAEIDGAGHKHHSLASMNTCTQLCTYTTYLHSHTHHLKIEINKLCVCVIHILTKVLLNVFLRDGQLVIFIPPTISVKAISIKVILRFILPRQVV